MLPRGLFEGRADGSCSKGPRAGGRAGRGGGGGGGGGGGADSPSALDRDEPSEGAVAATSGAGPSVSQGGQAMGERSGGTQTELPRKHAAVQVVGCKECQNFALATSGSSEGRCGDLLSLMAGLSEEASSWSR